MNAKDIVIILFAVLSVAALLWMYVAGKRK